jgi:phosphate transport system substrate-binding protein
MMKRSLPAWCLALCTAASGAPASAQEGPPYAPQQEVAGTIRIWGDEHMAAVTRYWTDGFRRYQPQVGFEIRLKGSGTAMPAIYHNVADLALLGRESDLTDDNGFFKSVGGYSPLRLELMNGSLTEPEKSGAVAVFVHQDNPLARLTVAELEAIFGEEHRRGPRNIRTWGDLGLGGEWTEQPIMLYAPDAESEAGVHFTRTVLAESRKMNWAHLAELGDAPRPDGSRASAAQQAVDALRGQRYGMALANVRYAGAGVKVLAIAAHEAAPYLAPTTENIVARTYPLGRRTYAFVNRRPGQPVEPALREFLRYVLSLEGQRDIVREAGYLPLSGDVLEQQRRKLD